MSVLALWPGLVAADEPRTFHGKTAEGWSDVVQNSASTVAERQQAIDALAALGPGAEAAVPALIGILNGPDPEMQGKAADALGQIGPPARAAVPALIRAIENPDAIDASNGLLHSSVRTLGLIGPEARAAVPALNRLLFNEIELSAVVDALDEIGAPPVRQLLQILLRIGSSDVAELLCKLGPKARAAVPELRKALGDRQSPYRYSVAAALASIEPSAVEPTPVLIDALSHLDDENVDVSVVLAALGRLGPRARDALPKLAEIVSEGCSDSDFFSALVQIDPDGKQCVPVLISALGSRVSDDDVVTAAEHLGLLGPRAKAAVPALARVVAHVFEQDDGTVDFRPPESAAKALQRIGPRARCAIPILAHALNRPPCRKRASEDYGPEHFLAAAAETLGSFREAARPAVPALVQLAEIQGTDEAAIIAREAAILALGQIRTDASAAVPVLRKLLEKNEASGRLTPAILVSLLQLDPPHGRALAENWLARNAGNDERGRERFKARYHDECAMVLGALGRTSAKSEWLARHYLEGIKTQLATPDLGNSNAVAAIDGSVSLDLEGWFECLGRCGPSARVAIPELTRYLSHPSPFVRLWASEALQKIGAPTEQPRNTEPSH
jgi:HEAT repeat protein